MTWDQMKDEIKNVARLFDEVYSLFGLPYEIELSTMPEDHMGDEKDWKFAQETLKEAITEMANNIRKNNGAIPGIRPGKPTSDFISRIISKTTLTGALMLAVIAILPIILGAVANMNISMGGTSFINCTPSVQPGITWFRPKSAGSLRW